MNALLYQDHSIKLWNGTATLSVAEMKEMKIGQKFGSRNINN